MSDNIIHFERGIPGFLEEKQFIFLQEDSQSPFGYLQSVQTKELSFIVASPFVFFPDYEVKLSDDLIERLEIRSPEDIALLVIVTVGEELSKSTMNLAAPIVINMKNLRGEQYILEGNKYTTKHPFLPQASQVAGGK